MKAVCIYFKFPIFSLPSYYSPPSQVWVSDYQLFSMLKMRAVLLTISTAQCSHYLCPGTLSCVHFPHHCPCAWENTEDKAELGDGIAICGSKGGWVEGEFGRKVELARKGLL